MADSYSVKAVLSAQDNMSDTLKKAAGLTESLDSKMGGMVKSGFLMGVGMKAASAAIGLVSKSMGGAIARFDTLNNFPKIMNNLGVSSDAAAKELDRASKAMEKLPTSLDDAASGIQRMTSVNGDVKKSTDYFLAMNDAIIAGGQSSQVQASALEQLSQAYSKGKMDMQEWRSIQQAMPAQLNQIAKAMGMTANDLGEGIRQGDIAMDDFMNTLVKLDSEGVDGLASFRSQAEEACGGIQTAFANLKTAVTRGIANTMSQVDASLQSAGLPKMGEMLNNLIPLIDGVFGSIGSGLGSLIELVGTNRLVQAGLVAMGLALATYATYSAMAAAASTALAIKQGVLNAVMALNPALLVVAGIVTLVAALVLAYKKSETFRKAVQALGKAFYNLIASVINAVKKIVSAVKSMFTNLSGIGQNIVRGLWNGAAGMVSWAVGKFKGLGKSILSGIKSALGIHSPSREFAKVGMYSALGLIQGAEKMTGKVQAAMLSMAAVPDSVKSANLSMSSDYSYGAQHRYEIVVPLEVNGKELARATAANFQDELASLTRRNNRKLGVI